MAYNRTYFRDNVVVDADFVSRLRLGDVIKGGTVFIGGRNIRITQNITIDDVNIIILADKIEGVGGSIQARTVRGVGQSAAGLTGPSITVLCRQLVGALSLTSVGGTGGTGAKGAQGAQGAAGKPGYQGRKPGGKGGKGGTGAKGGTGGTGGAGGSIDVRYITHVAGASGAKSIALLSKGGEGGVGGLGGPGGPGGEGGLGEPDGAPGEQGATGPQGDKGATGAAGTMAQQALSELDYWGAARAKDADGQWAAYRLRVAEYFFRIQDTLTLQELNAVIQLSAKYPQASVYRSRLLANQNIYGLARDFDIVPDFPGYESTFNAYLPPISQIFATANNMLLSNITLDQVRQNLQREIETVKGQIAVLETERQAAIKQKSATSAELSIAKQRVNKMDSLVRSRQQELENQHFDWGGLVSLGVFAVAMGVIAFTGGAGAALLPMAPTLLSLAGVSFLDSSVASQEQGALALVPDIGKKVKEATDSSKGLLDFDTWQQVGTALKPLVISFSKIIGDLNKAEGDPELIKLLTELTNLVHAQFMAQMQDEQATLLVQAAEQRLAQAKVDQALVTQQAAALTSDQSVLDTAAQTLIRLGRGFVDNLSRYMFFAARALEIYTLAELSGEIRYDYGFIQPDLEQDYLDGFRSRADYISRITSSVSAMIILSYRVRYDNYFLGQSWTHDTLFRSFSSPALLDQFRQTRMLSFSLGLADLPSSRYEAKVTGVRLSLVGATANAPAISCVVRHSGNFDEKRLADSATKNMLLRPRVAVAQASQSALAYTGGVVGLSPKELDFWGRGVAAGWMVFVEAEEIASKQINLSGLTKIEVELSYDAFWKSDELSLVSADLAFGDGFVASVKVPQEELSRHGVPALVRLGLSQPAPKGGTQVQIEHISGSVRVPTSVVIPAGARSATVPITATGAGEAVLRVSYGGVAKLLRFATVPAEGELAVA